MPDSRNLFTRDVSQALKFWTVVWLSFLVSALLLGFERAVGIAWDFHPDSVTYATLSGEVYHAISEHWIEVLNNGFYVVVYFLGESILAVTLMNMLIFSFTNGLIYKILNDQTNYRISHALMLLLLINPYRIHLSTTMLKDTLIIFFVIMLVSSSFSIKIFSFFSLLMLRIASPLYSMMFMSRKLMVYAIFAFAVCMAFNWEWVEGRVLEFNEQEMQLRDFDKIPTFQEYGLAGAVMRGMAWSFLAFSGLFLLVSPAPAFAPVALGSIMTLIFLKKATQSFSVPLPLLLATAVFGVMVTGFTAYIRYIYPILIVWPLIAVLRK